MSSAPVRILDKGDFFFYLDPMALQLFGKASCRDTQKLQRWLKERRIDFHNLDVVKKAPSPGELEALAGALGSWETLLDTQGSFYKKGGYAHLVFEPKEELAAHGELLRTPVLRSGRKAVQGFDPAALESFIREAGGAS